MSWWPVKIYVVKPNDARGWIGLGCFVLVLVVLGMIAAWPKLLENDAFLMLATAIVITGWVNGPVGWAYQATKGGGELAESNARIAEKAMSKDRPTGTKNDPIAVSGAEEGASPVAVEETNDGRS